MSATMHGVVTGVRTQTLGDELAAPILTMDRVIQVGDVADFISESGGWLLLTGAVYEYVEVDDDAATVTLAAPYVGPTIPIDTRVDVWDAANGIPAIRNIAIVDEIDGFEGSPSDVTITQDQAHALAESMRTTGKGESVTLERANDGELVVKQIHGRAFSLAALQYLQGGMTTRLAEDDAGIDIVGDEDGAPGIFAYGAGGSPTVIIDALTGDASFIGEIGTNLPGGVGIFLYSLDFQTLGDRVVTRPVMQFNVGATRDQPSIQSDTAGGSNLMLFSGANTGNRETQVNVQQALFRVGIESVADDETYAGAIFEIRRDGINQWTDEIVGPDSSHQGVSLLQDGVTLHGYFNPTNGAQRGFGYLGTLATDFARVYTATKMDVVDVDASVYKGINASAFTVSSDRRRKRKPAKVTGALEQLAAIPVYDYDNADVEQGRSRGVMAQDVQSVIPHAAAVQHLGKDAEDETLGVDLYALLATAIAGLQELTSRVERLEK